MSIINTIIKQTEQFLPLALGLAQDSKQPKPTIDFSGAASQIIAQMEAVKRIISTQERISAIQQIENTVYAWQRLPQDKTWKSKDNAAFKQIEATLVNKLNELRNFSPVLSSNGQIITEKDTPISSNTGESLLNSKYLVYGGITFLGFWLLKR